MIDRLASLPPPGPPFLTRVGMSLKMQDSEGERGKTKKKKKKRKKKRKKKGRQGG
jgi:hypothetical protein